MRCQPRDALGSNLGLWPVRAGTGKGGRIKQMVSEKGEGMVTLFEHRYKIE